MPERPIAQPHDAAPLNADTVDLEFRAVREVLAASIAEHHLKITPERFWEEFQAAIQFVPFDKYLSLINKIIDDHQGKPEIVCFYVDQTPYSEVGPITNSDQFMIRLLSEVVKKRNLNLNVRLFDSRYADRRQNFRVAIIDDAMYTGAKIVNDVRKLAPNVQSDLYVVASTQDAVTTLKHAMPINVYLPEPSKIVYMQRLSRLIDQLSPEGAVVFRDLHAFQVMSTETRPARYSDDAEWKTSLIGAAGYHLEKPLVFNPFKLPDMTSTFTNILQNVVPVAQQRGYVDPTSLLFGEDENTLASTTHKAHEVKVTLEKDEPGRSKLYRSVLKMFGKDTD